MWDPPWSGLTADRDVVTPDVRGFGESATRARGVLSAVIDVLDTLTEVDIYRCHFVDCSLGVCSDQDRGVPGGFGFLPRGVCGLEHRLAGAGGDAVMLGMSVQSLRVSGAEPSGCLGFPPVREPPQRRECRAVALFGEQVERPAGVDMPASVPVGPTGEIPVIARVSWVGAGRSGVRRRRCAGRPHA